MTQNAQKFILIDSEALDEIREIKQMARDILQNTNSQSQNQDQVEWITNKKFMEKVSIRAYNTFAPIRDKMPSSMKREINGKHYVHKDAVNEYFKGSFNS